jgi:hypothetical protein
LSNSIPDFPAFDLLVGRAKTPYRGFGGVADSLERQLHMGATKVRLQIRETFGVELTSATAVPRELDNIVEEMWKTGWDPHVGQLNLFTFHFGLMLFEATLSLLGGKAVLRSPGDDVYLHTSIFWPGVEAFPFHKAFKCLTRDDGETMAYFLRGLGQQLEERGLLGPDAKARLPSARHSRSG